jgi:hypothetical protein
MVGRNDPCPCGSGKKYKKCCLGSEKTFMESQGTPNMSTDLLNKLKIKLEDTPFSSLEELNEITSIIIEEEKSSFIDDFLGLSSDQMHGILYNPLGSPEDILTLSDGTDLNAELLSQIPVIKQSLFILDKLGEFEKGVKATKTGNLPRVIVQSFYQKFRDDIEQFIGKPSNQNDLKELDVLVFALKETGLIKIRTGWFSLTKKGMNSLNEKNYFDLYSKLFFFYGDSLDWLSMTYYDGGFGIIQKALSFNLYILKKRAKEFISQKEIVDLFHKAFPQVGEVSIPFVSLFLDDFCLYFGLVERDGFRNLLDKRKDFKYRQSSLFSELLKWK